MKIAIVTLYDIGSYGGTSKVLCELANGLNKRGHEIKIFYFSENNKKIKYRLCEKIKIENCCLGAIDRYLRSFWISKVLAVFSLSRKNRRISRCRCDSKNKSKSFGPKIRDFNPDIIVSFSQYSTYMLMADVGVRVPVITMLHNNPASYFDRPEFELFKFYLERCAAIQVLMPDYIQSVLKYLHPKHIEYIPNVIPQYVETASLDLPVIINVARICSVKRQHLLIKAFSLVCSRYPEWKVELWGGAEGPYAEKLKDLISKNQLSEKVFIRGITDNIKGKLLNASIFAFPSEREGFSLALGEAMSMGLPVIGCKSCSSVNKMIVNNYNGLLCEDTPEDIAQALELLMKNHTLRKQLGERAKQSMYQFSDTHVYNKWENLLHLICNEKLVSKQDTNNNK